MSAEQRAFDGLTRVCTDLLNSKLILSSGKITAVLNLVAADAVLKKTVADAMTGFDYRREFLNSVYEFGGKIRFKLPPSPKNAAALVVNMLYEFDGGAINFVEFITTTFQGDRAEDCYRAFGENVIKPFLEHMKELIFSEIPPLSAAEKVDAERIFVGDALLNSSEYIIKNLHGAVVEQSPPDETVLHFMIDGLKYAMELRDLRLIKVAFLGLKSMLRGHKRFVNLLAELEGVIRMYTVK
ncbi:MAG: hypothetical protein LBP62_06480 [Clostridiales bacterium]|jgi:hypothetical protein|nr:hypothetical protein [Clostridiales bacterium]